MIKRLLAGILAASFLFQSLGLASSVYSETIEMKYNDPAHLHAPKEVNEMVYQYDENGNLENDGEREISWNQDNLPTKIVKGDQEVEFFYDANGRRIAKKVGANKTIYVNQYYQLSAINNQQLAIKYYFANGRIAQEASDNLSFLHQNYLGSTILATNSDSQSLGKALVYFPYGNFTNHQSPITSHYLFTNQELDPETNFYNYKARQYDPKTGAFISADTVQGLNRYAYVSGNPINFVDPSGHQGGGGGVGGNYDGPWINAIPDDASYEVIPEWLYEYFEGKHAWTLPGTIDEAYEWYQTIYGDYPESLGGFARWVGMQDLIARGTMMATGTLEIASSLTTPLGRVPARKGTLREVMDESVSIKSLWEGIKSLLKSPDKMIVDDIVTQHADIMELTKSVAQGTGNIDDLISVIGKEGIQIETLQTMTRSAQDLLRTAGGQEIIIFEETMGQARAAEILWEGFCRVKIDQYLRAPKNLQQTLQALMELIH